VLLVFNPETLLTQDFNIKQDMVGKVWEWIEQEHLSSANSHAAYAETTIHPVSKAIPLTT